MRPIIDRFLKHLQLSLTLVLLFIVALWDTFSTLNLVSHCNNEMTQRTVKIHIIISRWAKALYTQKPCIAKMNNKMNNRKIIWCPHCYIAFIHPSCLIQVSKKVSELVLENHPAYEKELCSVMELQDTLQRAGVICANGRRSVIKVIA